MVGGVDRWLWVEWRGQVVVLGGVVVGGMVWAGGGIGRQVTALDGVGSVGRWWLWMG